MTTGRRARRARRAAATPALGGVALVAAGCNLGEAPVSYPGPSGRVEAADLDDDGDLDLVTVRSLGNEDDGASVLLNDGDGAFTATQAPAPYEVLADLALGDLDGDGHLDVVTAAQQGSGGTVLYGDGAGHFGDAHALSGDRGPQATAVVVAPLDAGTSPDVVFGRGAWDTASDTAVLLNTSGSRRQH